MKQQLLLLLLLLLTAGQYRSGRSFTGIVRTDDITFEQNGLTGSFFLAKLLEQTLLRIECNDTNDEQIHRRGQNGQTEKDERHAEEEVLGMMHEFFITMMLLLVKGGKSRLKQTDRRRKKNLRVQRNLRSQSLSM
jgi:hypothetical protein